MRLADCEVTHRHIRGHNVAFLFGPRGISDTEARALAEEWAHTYGPVRLPAYASPDGWRTLYPSEAGPIAARLQVDEDRGVIAFDGVKFTADLLATFAAPTPEGFAFRILKAEDGVATVQRLELPAVTPQTDGGAPAPANTPVSDGQAAAPAPARKATQPRKPKVEA